MILWKSEGKSVVSTEKKGLKISKFAKFETDLLKTNEGIAPQSPEILQTFV